MADPTVLPGPSPKPSKPDMAMLLLREGEEARVRAFEALEHAGDPVILAQDLHAAGEAFIEAADLIARRARAAAQAGRTTP